MNIKVIFIAFITLGGLVLLTLFSFGPLSSVRKNLSVNPASLKPDTTTTSSTTNKNIALSLYHNRDLKENYYAISLPKDWHIQSGKQAGGYDLNFSTGTGVVELQDVNDNTTLELFVLSQEEPRFKKDVSGYVRQDYKKISINGSDAYQLIYTSTEGSKNITTIKTYITGADHAGVVTLSSGTDSFKILQPLFEQIITSFHFEI